MKEKVSFLKTLESEFQEIFRWQKWNLAHLIFLNHSNNQGMPLLTREKLTQPNFTKEGELLPKELFITMLGYYTIKMVLYNEKTFVKYG